MPSATATATKLRPLLPALLRSGQRGLSLVELMVGIAVGLFVVAAATTVVSTQLSDNRRLLLEVQLQQDLRATADIITRDLRRAGSWTHTVSTAGNGTWAEGVVPMQNPNLQVSPVSAGGEQEIEFRSARTRGTDGPYGFKLLNGVIQSRLPNGAYQDLTDPATMKVTSFTIAPDEHEDAPAEPLRVTCAKLCEPNPADPKDKQHCWPQLQVRKFRIFIAAEAVGDDSVKRTISSRVRLRNDAIVPEQVCPA